MKVVWVTPKLDLREGAEGIYSRIASTRYRALIPARALAARGHEATVAGLDQACFDSVQEQIAGADFVVFRKNYDDAQCTEQMLEKTRGLGVKTLFDVSDDRFRGDPGPHLRHMIAGVDTVVTASPLLQEIVKQHTGRDSVFVGDPYEGARAEPRWAPKGARLQALWFGHGSNFDSLQQAIPALVGAGKKKPIDLRVVTKGIDGIERDFKAFNSKYRNALTLRYAEWSAAETWSSLATADFVVIPAKPDELWTLAKSPNRIIESLWAGRFVVGHPIPSYMEFKEWAWLGEDLAQGIAWMVDNPTLIAERIRLAQEYISSTYSPDRIALDWEKIFEKA
jgi:glycosyltransferase involved in cell wall biosynthesis